MISCLSSQMKYRKQGDLLLEENGSETGVESADTLVLQHLAEAADEAAGIGGLGDETDTGSLKRAEGNVGEELGSGGGSEVDGSAVVGGGLKAEQVDALLLEELVTTELEGTLEEVTSEGRADTGEESTCTLVLDDLAEATDHAIVVGGGVELDASLDAVVMQTCQQQFVISTGQGHWAAGSRRAQCLGRWTPCRRRDNIHIDGGEGTVGDGAADGTSESEAGIEVGSAHGGSSSGLSLLDDGVDLGSRAGHFGYLGLDGKQRLSGDGLTGRKRGQKEQTGRESRSRRRLAIEPFWRVEVNTEAREGGEAGAAEKQSQETPAEKKLVR